MWKVKNVAWEHKKSVGKLISQLSALHKSIEHDSMKAQ